MGSSSSKQSPETPADTSQSTENLFRNINTPIIFTNPLISHLDSSKESNSTRSASLEAHIQSRVQSELSRLQARSDELQDKLEEKLKSEGLITERGATNLSSITLSGDIKELRQKFVGVKDGTTDLEARKARDGLVQCLQLNDRRPLDCWWEVKQFKDKVAKLEKEFVEKNQ